MRNILGLTTLTVVLAGLLTGCGPAEEPVAKPPPGDETGRVEPPAEPAGPAEPASVPAPAPAAEPETPPAPAPPPEPEPPAPEPPAPQPPEPEPPAPEPPAPQPPEPEPPAPEPPAPQPPEPEPPAPEPPPPVPQPPPPQPEPPPVPQPPPTPAPPATTQPEVPAVVSADPFVGAAACKTCHFKEHRYWKKTRLAKSLDALAPTPVEDTELTARKRAAGLDPRQDYSSRQDCLRCHTTGFGATGGYPRNPTSSADAQARADEMGSVSCEACHGAGGRYVAHKKARLEKDDKAKFTREELVAQGLRLPDRAVCAECHNDRGPTAATDPFDFDRDKELVHSKKRR